MHDKPLVQVATAASCPSLLVVSEKNENVINCSTDFLQLWHYIQIYFFQCCNGAGKCISYRAIIIPRLAAHTQAPIMKLPCSKMNNLDFALTGPTSPRPAGLPETIWKSIIVMILLKFSKVIMFTFERCLFRRPSWTEPWANMTWYLSLSRSQFCPSVMKYPKLNISRDF